MMDKRMVSFLGMAFGFTWAFVIIGYLLGVRDVSHMGYTILAALCMLGPAGAAVIQQRVLDRSAWSGLGLPLKGTHWGVVAMTAVLGMSIVPLFFLVQHVLGSNFGTDAFGAVSITTERMVLSIEELLAATGQAGLVEGRFGFLRDTPAGLVLLAGLGAALLSAFTFNLPFMLGEELGWRGYLWQRTAHWSGLRRVMFTGTVWGLWHAPLIAMGHNYPDHRVAGIGMMVLFCLLLSLLFDWTRTRSGSIWSACILHGLINGTAGLSALFAYGGHALVGSLVGVSGFVTCAVLALLVLLFDARYRATFFSRSVPVQEALPDTSA